MKKVETFPARETPSYKAATCHLVCFKKAGKRVAIKARENSQRGNERSKSAGKHESHNKTGETPGNTCNRREKAGKSAKSALVSLSKLNRQRGKNI